MKPADAGSVGLSADAPGPAPRRRPARHRWAEGLHAWLDGPFVLAPRLGRGAWLQVQARLPGRAGHRRVALLLLFTFAVFCLGLVSSATRFGPDVPLYGPAGALGAVVLCQVRPRSWAPYLTAILVATMAYRTAAGGTPAAATVLTVADVVLAGVFAAFAAAHLRDDRVATGIRAVVKLVGFGLVAAACAGMIVALGLAATGRPGWSPALFGLTLAGAGVLGLVTVAPLARSDLRAAVASSRRGYLIVSAAVVLAATELAFGHGRIGFAYLPFGIVLLAVGQVGMAGAVLLPLLMLPLAYWHTSVGQGPWGDASLPFGRTLAVQGYALAVVVGALLIGTLAGERRAALERMARSNRRLESMVVRRTVDLQRLQELTEVASDAGTLDDLLAVLLPRIRRAVPVDTVRVLLAEGDDLVEVAAAGTAGPGERRLRVPRGSGLVGRVAAAKASRVLTDARRIQADPALGDGPALVAAAGVPLLVDGGELAGVLLVGSGHHGAFADEGSRTMPLLERIGGRIAAAVVRTRLVADLAAQAGRNQVLADLGQALAEARLDEHTTTQTIAEHVTRAIGDTCVISIVDDDGVSLRPAAVSAADPALDDALHGISASLVRRLDEPGPAAQVLSTGMPFTAAAEPRQLAEISPPPVRDLVLRYRLSSVIVVPLEAPGDVAGVVSTHRSRDRAPYTADDVRFLQDIAGRAAPAVANARLHARAEAMARRLHGLMDAGVAGVFVVDDGVIVEANAAFAAMTGHRPDDLAAGRITWQSLVPGPATKRCLERLAAEGRVDAHEADAVRADGSPVPILVAGAAVGASPLRWIGLALDRTEAWASQQRQARRAVHAEILSDCSRLAQETGTLDGSAMHHLTGEVAARVGGGCTVLRVEGGQVTLAGVGHEDPDIADLVRRGCAGGPRTVEPGLLSGVLDGGEPVTMTMPEPQALRRRIPDSDDRLPTWQALLERLAGTTASFIPLTARGATVGLLFAQRLQPYTPDEFAFLSALAERMALAIDNERLLEARAAVQLALADSEERLRLAFDEAPVGGALISLEEARLGEILKVNHALEELTGFGAHALVGVDCRTLSHPGDRETKQAVLDQLAAGVRTHQQWEQRLIRRDRHVLLTRVTASAVQRDGRPWYAVAHVEDVSDRRDAEEQLIRRALYDPLTGLANRHLLMDHLRLALKQLSRGGGAVGVLYLDLDRFKNINDSLGHEAGDEVLRQVGTRLASAVRAPDTAARLGGDEFVVVGTNLTDEHDALRIAERIVAALVEPIEVSGEKVVTGASIGVVTTRSPKADPADLLRHADTAMYQAKHRDRGRIVVYDVELADGARHRSELENDLVAALRESWLRLHYQPIVDLTDGRVVAAEALLRIQHPDRGLILPQDFIDVAEDSELILPIGAWALQEACLQLARWREACHLIDVSVNVSSRQAGRHIVTEQVVAATTAAGVNPAGLSVEMAERVLLEAGDSVVRDLRNLTGLGVKLALDGFGTGYSSLTYLKSFPVHTVKIDRSFVSGLGRRAEDTAIVEAVIALARALGLNTVAEGVEDQEQLETLRGLGCRQAQGFRISPPLPPDEVTGLLAAGRSLLS